MSLFDEKIDKSKKKQKLREATTPPNGYFIDIDFLLINACRTGTSFINYIWYCPSCS